MKHFPYFISLFAFLFSATTLLGQCLEITSDIEELYCPGEEITLTATPGYDGYSWFYNFSDSNEGGTLLMQTGSSNTITLSASEWAVSYIYVAVDDNNCTEPSPTVVWDSYVFGSIAISHEANTSICPGDSSLIENAFNGPANFQWYLDFEPIEGATSSSYWVTAPGTYTLQASYPECPDYFLNSGVGPTFDYYDLQIPNIAFEMVDGQPSLYVPFGNDIQWYLDGEAIIGANALSLTPSSSGAYSFTAVDENGCSVIAEPYLYTILNSESLTPNAAFEVYPNPFQANIFINMDGQIRNGTIRIYDLSGKQLGSQKQFTAASPMMLNLEELNSGIYFLEISTENGHKELVKLIKNK